MSNRLANPNIQFLDNSGVVLSGAFLFFYVTGTSTKTNTYSDAALTTPNSNPITLDSAGRSASDIFLDPSITYKVVLAPSTDSDPPTAAIWTRDPVVDLAANVTASFQAYSGDPNGNVAGNAGSVGGAGASVVWDIANNLLYICTTTGTASTAVWTQQNADLSGALIASSTISPSSIGANQNDYAPTGFSTAYTLRVTSSADYNITGIAGGAAGRLINLVNIGSNTLTLKDEDTNSTAANRFALPNDAALEAGASLSLYYDGTSSRWRLQGSMPFMPGFCPGGRLTLTTAVPVLTSDVTGATTVYYTPYLNNLALISDGNTLSAVMFSELSQATTDATKSPAAVGANEVFDMFLWNDSGTLRCTRGPAWSSATSRGTGAGTTELDRLNGVRVNKVAITNGPGALSGVYVGTIASDASSQLNMMLLPSAAAGGSANRIDVWNMYNRIHTASVCRDSTDSWTYTTATIRAKNGNNSNRITFVQGLDEHCVDALNYTLMNTSGSGTIVVHGIGLDSTTAFAGGSFPLSRSKGDNQGGAIGSTSHFSGLAGLGRHYLQSLEYSTASGTTTWYGDNGTPTLFQGGLRLTLYT